VPEVGAKVLFLKEERGWYSNGLPKRLEGGLAPFSVILTDK